MKTCESCIREDCIYRSDLVIGCNRRVRRVTNGDRIRAMTDEELAEKLSFWDNSPLYASKEKWFDWLKEEAVK